VRYHDKLLIIDRRVLYVLSFNFTHLDIDHSRGFGIITKKKALVEAALKLIKADTDRVTYEASVDALVVSPVNARKQLLALIRRAKKELLIYDPVIADSGVMHALHERSKKGVAIRVVGTVSRRTHGLQVRSLRGLRLHTRTIIRDGRQAFIGSQSLREQELDKRREVGVIIHDAKAVKTLLDTFAKDWEPERSPRREEEARKQAQMTEKETEDAAKVLEKDMHPIVATMKKAVKRAVAKAGDEVLNDKGMKDTVKRVVKKAVRDAVQAAVKETRAAAKKNRKKE
jgi:cardiolipin synthase A/B